MLLGSLSRPVAAAPSSAPPTERNVEGPTEVAWPQDDARRVELDVPDRQPPSEAPTDSPTDGPDASDDAAEPAEPTGDDAPTSVPPPTVHRAPPITVGVGLAPSAPGTKSERALLDRLEKSVLASERVSTVRRLRAGTGEPRRVCNQRRDDLVIMIGYVADRPEPVVLAHDCLLDEALALRSGDAVDEPGLVASLWDEHEALVARGVRERRRWPRLGPGARAGIAAGIAVVVIGVAVGVLVANTLRDERVVLTVSP